LNLTRRRRLERRTIAHMSGVSHANQTRTPVSFKYIAEAFLGGSC